MATFPAELSRAWRRYFTATESARVSSDVLSVVILEDFTKGPYPPSRIWWAGDASAVAGAGVFSYLTLRNNGQRGSVVVVDRIRVRATAPSVIIALSTAGFALADNGGSKIATDRAPEAQAHSYSSGELFVGDINLAKQKSAGVFGYELVPISAATPQELEGLWIIGEGGEIVVRPSTANTQMEALFSGRYYTTS